jgi:hypothetical protein
MVFEALALQIYLVGQQNTPARSRNRSTGDSRRPLLTDIKAARVFFKTNQPTLIPIGIEAYETIIARFLITKEWFDNLSINFRTAVLSLGSILICDEKLFRFTGTSGHIMLVLEKPARIGLWFYEAVCVLDWLNLPFMVDMFMKLGSLVEAESPPMASVVQRWVDVNKSFRGVPAHMFFDSLYWTNASRQLLLAEHVSYHASVAAQRVEHIAHKIVPKISKPNEWGLMWNPTTQELLVQRLEAAKGLNTKTVFSNAYRMVNKKNDPTYIPAYDEYKVVYGYCDRFNTQLVDSTWPYKRGGFHVLGENGHEHDFALSVTLINTFNAFRTLRRVPTDTYSFEEYCTDLALQLYKHAKTLQ